MSGQENYLIRHPLLSLTSPEAPSLMRIRSLNHIEVTYFSGIYKKIVAGNRGGGLQDIYF